MISLSSIYFGIRKLELYDSIAKAKELGFKGVELRQEHYGSSDPWKTLKRIKKDFGEMEFTIHAPLWSPNDLTLLNPAMGLTSKNKSILNKVIKGAEIVEAKNILFHAGFRELILFNRIAWTPRIHWPILTMPRSMAKRKFKEFMKSALSKAAERGIQVVVENPAPSKMPGLFNSKQDFEELFAELPGLCFALDMSHSFAHKKLDEFLELANKVKEVHVAYTNTDQDLHLPVSMEHLEPLKKIPKIGDIPLVLEHNAGVSIEELLEEKKTVEKFLKKF
tara:strand:+ start:5412 stop:6245 length:834 start_codon:yes stop_codon:yes gene_type:complete